MAILAAIREPNTRHDFDGLPDLRLRGLAEEDARTLLMSAVPGRIDDRVRDRIVAETAATRSLCSTCRGAWRS